MEKQRRLAHRDTGTFSGALLIFMLLGAPLKKNNTLKRIIITLPVKVKHMKGNTAAITN